MSEENVEIVRKAFEGWDAGGDLGEGLALLHDDLVVRRLAPMPDPGTWHGPEGLLDLVAEWMEAFDDFSIRAEEYIDAEDYVVVRTAQGGRGTGGGVPVMGVVWFVYSFRDRKVITLDIYATRRQALEAAGLSE